MTISLTPEQVRWLEAEVAAGRISSVEAGVRFAVAEFIYGGIDEDDDLEWAKPMVDEALAEIDQGKGVELQEAKKIIEERLRKLACR